MSEFDGYGTDYRGDDLGKCATCGEPNARVQTGKGKNKRFHVVCACPETQPVVPEKQGRKKCSPKNAKAKGDEGEREVRRFLEGVGFQAYRTSGSGAAGTKSGERAFATDVRAKFGDLLTMRVESKREATLPIAGLKTRLADSDWLRVRQDHDKAYWFVPEDKLAEVLKWAVEGLRSVRDA